MTVRVVVTRVRGCGKRKTHGVYAVGGGEGSPDGVLARFVRLNPPIPYPVKLHRGPRIVDAHAVLARLPMETWWAGASKDTEQKKSADAWAQETFGMTLHKRLETGECAGAKSADEAWATLAEQVRWSHRLADYFRELTLEKVQELPRVTPHYDRLHEHLLRYADDQQVGDLMGAQAALWRIGFTLPPAKRPAIVPLLMRMLVLLNLPKDASAMQRTFLSGGINAPKA